MPYGCRRALAACAPCRAATVPETACASAEEAARAVIGVQAQDLRAAELALRSRVPGLTRAAVRAAPLLRTWTVRGTVHLITASDRPWLHALLAERNARVFGARFSALASSRRSGRCAGTSSTCVPSVPRPRPLCSALCSSEAADHRAGSDQHTRPMAVDTGADRQRHRRPAARGRSACARRRRRGARDPGAATAPATGPATRATSRNGPRCRSAGAPGARGGRRPSDARRVARTTTRRPVSCSRHSTPSCSGTAPASRSSPPTTTITC